MAPFVVLWFLSCVWWFALPLIIRATTQTSLSVVPGETMCLFRFFVRLTSGPLLFPTCSLISLQGCIEALLPWTLVQVLATLSKADLLMFKFSVGFAVTLPVKLKLRVMWWMPLWLMVLRRWTVVAPTDRDSVAARATAFPQPWAQPPGDYGFDFPMRTARGVLRTALPGENFRLSVVVQTKGPKDELARCPVRAVWPKALAAAALCLLTTVWIVLLVDTIIMVVRVPDLLPIPLLNMWVSVCLVVCRTRRLKAAATAMLLAALAARKLGLDLTI